MLLAAASRSKFAVEAGPGPDNNSIADSYILDCNPALRDPSLFFYLI
jgi:hypothetical protein